MTPVVAGVLRRDGRYMLARRVRGAEAGCWEFPGGKLEQGESPEQALERELCEELGISVRVGGLIGCIADWNGMGGSGLILLFYSCKLVDGEPKCLDCGGVTFVEERELVGMELAHNDREFVERWLHTGGQEYCNG